MVPTPEEVLVVWCRRAIKMDRACGLSFIGAVRVRVSGLQWYGTDRSNLLWTSLLSPNLPTNVLLLTTLRRSKGTGKTRENGQYFTCGSKTRVGQDRRLPLPATGVTRQRQCTRIWHRLFGDRYRLGHGSVISRRWLDVQSGRSNAGTRGRAAPAVIEAIENCASGSGGTHACGNACAENALLAAGRQPPTTNQRTNTICQLPTLLSLTIWRLLCVLVVCTSCVCGTVVALACACQTCDNGMYY